MLIALLLLVSFQTRDTDKWLKDLRSDDPQTRESATINLIRHICLKEVEGLQDDKEAEVKWRAQLISKTIRHFQSLNLTSLLKSRPDLCVSLSSVDVESWPDEISEVLSAAHDALTLGEIKVLCETIADKSSKKSWQNLFMFPREKCWWLYLAAESELFSKDLPRVPSPLTKIFPNLNEKTRDFITNYYVSSFFTDSNVESAVYLSSLNGFSNKQALLIVQNCINRLNNKKLLHYYKQIVRDRSKDLTQDQKNDFITTLIKWMENKDTDICNGSAFLLPEIAGDQALEIFFKLIKKGNNSDLYKECARNLAREIPPDKQKEALESIMQAFSENKDPEAFSLALSLLSLHFSKELAEKSLDVIEKSLDSKKSVVVANAIVSLANVAYQHNLKQELITKKIVESVKSCDSEVKLAALESISKLSRMINDSDRSKLVSILAEFLADSNAKFRDEASWALRNLVILSSKAEFKSIFDSVIKLAQGNDDNGRHGAAVTLGRLSFRFDLKQIEETNRVLKTLLNDKNPAVCQDAAWSLGQIANKLPKDMAMDLLKVVDEKLKTVSDNISKERLVRVKEILEATISW